MRAIREVIEQAADTNATVLIRGESGVGKDLVARAIHAASPRHERPFVKVNCAALPGELLESELFGHERGAFTGAHRRKLGKFEFANNGTIFLDEIGELSRALQAKLLHVLQDQEFSRIGAREAIRIDVRVIAATNRDLDRALGDGEFREDLYYRLNVVEIGVPPLRERKEEVQILAAAFLANLNQQYHRDASFSSETLALFAAYSWPGNVRELENLVRRLVVLGSPSQVHEEIRRRLGGVRGSPGIPPRELLPTAAKAPIGLREIARLAAREAERKALANVLESVRWNRAEAARILKVSYKTLLSRIAELNLAPKQPPAPPREPEEPPTLQDPPR